MQRRGDKKDIEREEEMERKDREHQDIRLRQKEGAERGEKLDRKLDERLEADKKAGGKWYRVQEYKEGARTTYEILKDPNFYEKFKVGSKSDNFYVQWAKNLIVAIQKHMRSETQEQGYFFSWLESRFRYKTHNDVKYLNRIKDANNTHDLLQITQEILNDASSGNKSLRILVAAHLPFKHDFAIDQMLGIKTVKDVAKPEGPEAPEEEGVNIKRIKRIADMPDSKEFVNNTARIVDHELQLLDDELEKIRDDRLRAGSK